MWYWLSINICQFQFPFTNSGVQKDQAKEGKKLRVHQEHIIDRVNHAYMFSFKEEKMHFCNMQCCTLMYISSRECFYRNHKTWREGRNSEHFHEKEATAVDPLPL